MSRRAWSYAARDSVALVIRTGSNRKVRRAAFSAAARGLLVFSDARFLYHEARAAVRWMTYEHRKACGWCSPADGTAAGMTMVLHAKREGWLTS